MNNLYLAMNGWREILARVFEGFHGEDNISPDWLVNPATRRRLKLDRYYPEIGIAIRFVGLTAKGQRRRSDWEVLEDEQRDQTRDELCRLHGVALARIDPTQDPVKQMDNLLRILARASRQMAQGDREEAEKARWMPRLAEARSRAAELRSRVARAPEQMMANLAESWRDREAGLAATLQASTRPVPSPSGPGLENLSLHQRVRHERYGEGIITGLQGDGEEATVTILFDAEQERTFLVALVRDKLEAVPR